MNHNIDDTYRILNTLDNINGVSQRKLSNDLGYSLGKINYLIKGLIHKGYVKLENFKHSENKNGYIYILTPLDFSEKIRIAREYLKRREAEYESLRVEIEELREKVQEIILFSLCHNAMTYR